MRVSQRKLLVKNQEKSFGPTAVMGVTMRKCFRKNFLYLVRKLTLNLNPVMMEVAEKTKVKENGTNGKKSLLMAINTLKNAQLEDLPVCYSLHL